MPGVMVLVAAIGSPASDASVSEDPPAGDAAVAGTRDGSVRCSELRNFADHAGPKVLRRQVDETEAAWRERMLRELVLNRRLVAQALAADGDSRPVLRQRWNRARVQLLLTALEEDLGSEIEIRPEEIERRYQAHRERFSSPEKIATQLILLRLPPDAEPEAVQAAEERLRDLRRQHLAGTAFGELARRHSQAENAARGGIVATSPRGRLVPEFEEAAWRLKPGEVSDVVRLPDGVALILLNKRVPARDRGLDDVRTGIETRLRHEKTQHKLERALAQVCSPWPPEIDESPLTEETVLLHAGEEAVRLQDLNIDVRRPGWRETVEATLEQACRLRLAVERGIEERPEIAGKLEARRHSLLAAYAMDRQLQADPPEVPEERLKAIYQQYQHLFEIPEQRTFEAIVVAGDDQRLRPTRAQALAVARRWQEAESADGGPAAVATTVTPAAYEDSADARSKEVWGPMEQSTLAALTSPKLAQQAFALEPGEISEPIRLERYETQRSRFRTEGYAVLRLQAIEPASFKPFEQARARILRYAARDEFQRLAAEIRQDVLAQAELAIDPEALAACRLPVSPAADAEGEDGAGDGSPAGDPWQDEAQGATGRR